MNKFTVLQPTLPVLSTSTKKVIERFPIHRIYCVGRNYRDHAIEMGGDPVARSQSREDREPPFFFQKPPDAIVDTDGEGKNRVSSIPYPTKTSSLHHEAELVVAIGKDGLHIKPENANDYIFGYAIGCDLTRRDLQTEAKLASRPWCCAKGFDYSAPIGMIVPKDDTCIHSIVCNLMNDSSSKSNVLDSTIQLKVNDEIRQNSTLDKMTWNVPEIISHLSGYFRLKAGDLIMTGTPDGVNAIEVGDNLSISCGDLPPCNFTIVDGKTSAY